MEKLSEILLLRSIIQQVALSVRAQDFLTYFKKISLLHADESVVIFGVVSSFMRDNLSQKFFEEVKTATQKLCPTIQTIEFQVDKDIDNPSNGSVIDCQKEYKELLGKKKKEDGTPGIEMVEGIASRQIQEKYRLDNFIVGQCNQLPYAACEAVSRKPGSAYNPLYIYGDVGLGKTHLLQGTGNAIKKRFKDKKVVYTTADRFLREYVSSVQKRTVDRLREKYQNIDVLLIDDVQFLVSKKQTQEELYNIFNLMYDNNKQIILSGDRPPRELTELEPRLRSRCEWGIIVDVSAPDFETRLAILQEKARGREFIIQQDVAEFIAKNSGSNVREIEGILNQIIAEYELHQTPPTMENVARKMNKLSITDSIVGGNSNFPAAQTRIKSYDELLQAIADHFGIEKKALIG